MRKFFKIALATGAVAIFLLLLIVGGFALLAFNSLPEFEGEARYADLTAKVTIATDRHGVAHIEAQKFDDALFALGFVHGRDRLWQIDLFRLSAEGRLSEVFGSQTIEADRFLKTVDLAMVARKSYAHLEDRTKTALTAYANGLNAYVKHQTEKSNTILPLEFVFLNRKPELFEPWHSLAVMKLMALTLDANLNAELSRFALAVEGFSPEEIDELHPLGPRENPMPLPDLREVFKLEPPEKLAGIGFNDNSNGMPISSEPVFPTGVHASNNWVISGQRTKSGKPLLANDPHLPFTTPGLFHLGHLRFPLNGNERNIYGAFIPGIPFAILGRNNRLASGLTNTVMDSQDLFLEKLVKGDPSRYHTPDGVAEFEKEKVIIRVKGADDVSFTRRRSRHGPVLPGSYKKIGEILPKTYVAALSWTALNEADTTADGVMQMAMANNVDDFIADAAQKILSPMQSIVVADVDGNIALVAPALVPRRSPDNQIAGRAPVPGWQRVYDWQGYLRPDQTPKIVNPVNGALATANGNWLPANYPHHITYDWAEHFRQARVEELFVQPDSKHDIETMLEGQADIKSEAMLKFRDAALAHWAHSAGADEAVLSALRKWDGQMRQDRPEPLIMVTWQKNLEEAILADELGMHFHRFKQGNITRIIRLISELTRRNWCDRIRTAVQENCGQILSESFEQSLAELREKYGNNWRKWRWGEAHVAIHEHRPFTKVPLLDRLFTIRNPVDGGKYTLRRTSVDFSKDEPLTSHHGSVYRAIFDFSNLDNSQVITTTGQSGDLLSRHYDDFNEKWADVQYIKMSTKRKDYIKDARGTFTLLPLR